MSDGGVHRELMDEGVRRRFYGGVATEDDLGRVNSWLVAESLAGPDGGKFVSGVWNENLARVERRLAQEYRNRGLAVPESVGGGLDRVYGDAAGGGGGGGGKKGSRGGGGRRVGRRGFGDGADGDFGDGALTFGGLVRMSCGEDSKEWSDYERLRGLFGVELRVESPESPEGVD